MTKVTMAQARAITKQAIRYEGTRLGSLTPQELHLRVLFTYARLNGERRARPQPKAKANREDER